MGLGAERQVVLARELTKTYEEVWRGDLGGAIERVSSVAPKGEYVLVLAGAVEQVDGDDALLAALQKEAADGATRRDAVDTVVALTGAKSARSTTWRFVLTLSAQRANKSLDQLD